MVSYSWVQTSAVKILESPYPNHENTWKLAIVLQSTPLDPISHPLFSNFPALFLLCILGAWGSEVSMKPSCSRCRCWFLFYYCPAVQSMGCMTRLPHIPCVAFSVYQSDREHLKGREYVLYFPLKAQHGSWHTGNDHAFRTRLYYI